MVCGSKRLSAMRRRCWPLLLLALLPQCWSFVWHDKSGAVLKSVSILVGVLRRGSKSK